MIPGRASLADLDRPSTFATLAMDTDIKEKVKNDLDSFVASRDYYLSVGKARKRGLEVIVGGNGDIDYLVELHDRESAEHTKAPVCRPAPTPAPSTADEIDLEFIAALPPDIQAEVLAQQCAQRVAHQTKGQPVDMDNASIIATFPADLCEEANNHYPGVRCIHYTGPGPNVRNKPITATLGCGASIILGRDPMSSPGVVAADDPESENASSPTEVGFSCTISCQPSSSSGPGSQLRLRFEQETKLLRKSVAQVARRDKRIEARELEIKNLEALLETEAEMKRAAEDKSDGLIKELEDMRARFSDLQYEDERVERRCAELDARLDALSIDFDEELYPHMLTAIAGRRWVVGHGLRLAIMKCAESLEMRQAFAYVVSAEVAKVGGFEGCTDGCHYGCLISEERHWGGCPIIYTRSPPQLFSAHHPRVSGEEEKMPHSMPYSRGWLRTSCQVGWRSGVCTHGGPPGFCPFTGGRSYAD
nr:E3 ubiquitin-protein ligase UPL1 isoform X1 [Tanacetum cinerariifolium]